MVPVVCCVFVGMVIRSTPAILFAIEFVDIKFPFIHLQQCTIKQWQQLINRFLESECSFVQISYTHTCSVPTKFAMRLKQQLNYVNKMKMSQSTNVLKIGTQNIHTYHHKSTFRMFHLEIFSHLLHYRFYQVSCIARTHARTHIYATMYMYTQYVQCINTTKTV